MSDTKPTRALHGLEPMDGLASWLASEVRRRIDSQMLSRHHHQIRIFRLNSLPSSHSHSHASSADITSSALIASAIEAARKAADASSLAAMAAMKAAEAAQAAAEAARLAAAALYPDNNDFGNYRSRSPPESSQSSKRVAAPDILATAPEASSSNSPALDVPVATTEKDRVLDSLLPTLLNPNVQLLPDGPLVSDSESSYKAPSPLQSKDEGPSSQSDEGEGEGRPKLPELTQELIEESPVVAAAVIQAEATTYAADKATENQLKGAEAQKVLASSLIRALALAAYILSGGLERSFKIMTTTVQVSFEKVFRLFEGRREGGSKDKTMDEIIRTFALRLARMVAMAACIGFASLYVRRWVLSMEAVQSAHPNVKASLGQGIATAASTLIAELQSVLI